MKKQITLSYIPAIHEGYIKFLRENPHPLFLIGEEIIDLFTEKRPYFGRDIRAIESKVVGKMIESLQLVKSVSILTEKNISQIKKFSGEIIMPDEDITDEIVKRFLSNKTIKRKSVFLRWNRKISDKEFEVSPNRVISEEDFHRKMLNLAKIEAEKSSDWWRRVGAVLIKDGEIVFKSRNRHMPLDQNPNVLGDPKSSYDYGESDLCTAIHSEANIIAKAAKEGVSLKDSVLFVTTFPCPACARLIALSGIKEVYYSEGYSILDAEEILKNKVKIILVK